MRRRAARAQPAPAGEPARGSLHGPAIGFKPGVVLPPAPKSAFRPEPEPTEAPVTKEDVSKFANEKKAQAAKLAAQAADKAGKAARATQKAATEPRGFNKAARDILDDIESGEFFEMQPEFRARDRERFAEAVIDKATGRAVFGFITEAQILELLQALQGRGGVQVREVVRVQRPAGAGDRGLRHGDRRHAPAGQGREGARGRTKGRRCSGGKVEEATRRRRQRTRLSRLQGPRWQRHRRRSQKAAARSKNCPSGGTA